MIDDHLITNFEGFFLTWLSAATALQGELEGDFQFGFTREEVLRPPEQPTRIATTAIPGITRYFHKERGLA